MRLEQWMELYKVKPESFAKTIGKHISLIYNYMDGANIPKRDVLIKIYLETLGLVTPNDFYGISEELLLQEIERRKKPQDDWSLPTDAFRY
jgi:hypothetical protein